MTKACACSRAQVVEGGRVQGYFLSSYSARKLGMRTTGNAGGSAQPHCFTSRLTQSEDDLDAMLAKAGHGPLRHRVDGPGRELRHRRLLAQGPAASGWKGRIAYPVHEITIAATSRTCFWVSRPLGPTPDNYGAKTVGFHPDQPHEGGHGELKMLARANLTAADTAAISALPARRVLTTPITLPMSPGPLAPQFSHDGFLGQHLISRHALGQVNPAAPSSRLLPCRPGRTLGLAEGFDTVLALFDEFVDDGHDGGVVQHHALVHFLCFMAASSRRMVPRRSVSLARMAAFMSSVIWSLRPCGCLLWMDGGGLK